MLNCFSCSPSFLQHLQGSLQSCTLKLPFNYFNLQRDSLVLPHRASRPSIAQTVQFDWVNHRTLIAFLGTKLSSDVRSMCQTELMLLPLMLLLLLLWAAEFDLCALNF